MPNIPLMSHPPGRTESPTASDKKPDKMNLGRMAKVLVMLFLSMAVVVGLGWLIMPTPAESRSRDPALAMYAPNMAALKPWGYVVIHQLGAYDKTLAAEGGSSPATPGRLLSSARPARAAERENFHFVIGNGTGGLGDGQVQATRLWIGQTKFGPGGGPLENGIQITLVGDFTRSDPTAAQIDALVKLTTALQGRFRISTEHVLLHRELEAAACPGPRFSASQFFRRLCDFSRAALNS